MTQASIRLVATLVAGAIGVALLMRRAWIRGQRPALIKDGPWILGVAIAAVAYAVIPVDPRLLEFLAATFSAALCFLLAFHPGTEGTRWGAGLTRSRFAVLGVIFAVMAVGILILAASASSAGSS